MSWSSEILADAPSVWWRQDDASGTTMTDSSGNARHGTYTGTVTLGAASLIPSDSNADATFGGGHGSIAPASAAWASPSNLTVMAAYKPAAAAGTAEVVFAKWSTTATQQAWILQRVTGGQMQLGWKDTGGSTRTVTGTTVLAAGTPYLAYGTLDGTNGVIYLYNLSTGVGGLEATAVNGSLRTSSSSTIFVGDTQASSAPANGVIGEVALFGSALSSTRITAQSTAAITFNGRIVVPNNRAALHRASLI